MFRSDYFLSSSASGSDTAQEVSSGSGDEESLSVLKAEYYFWKLFLQYLRFVLPLHQTECDGASNIKEHGDQELPLEGEVGGVEERDGTTE